MHDIDEQHPHEGGWLRDVVFGLYDGLVTTLVFIMAVSGVAHTHLVLIALGEMLAGGVSMALGGYLSARTALEVLEQRIATERHEIKHEPEEERAELRAIYRRKGLSGALLERVVQQLTANDERWLHSMVRDELGVVEDERERPWRQGVLVGGAFMAGALIPILPFFTPVPWPQVWAYVLTALTALVLGKVKARYTLKGALRNSLEMLGIVTVGTIAGVAIGAVLHAI
jgi:vacuolar iron transporter family protein